jgi:two-component system, NarL family, sensor histidine kinase UhpB
MEHQNVRLLVIEDDKDDYTLVEHLLSEVPGVAYSLEWARDRDEGLHALRNDYHDICLLDYRLGEHDGMGILRWARDTGCTIPIILLTGHGDLHIDLEAMKAGAADYLSKNEVTSSLLERSIRNAVGRRRAEEALRESEERFRFLAENSGDVLYRLRYDCMRYDYLSPSISLLTGYSCEEIERVGFSSLVLRIDMEGSENVEPSSIKHKRMAGETGEYRADYLIRTLSGKHKWVSDHSVPWLDRSGLPIGSTGILADISERKRSEEAVRESEKQLRMLSSRLLTVQEAERARIAQTLHDTIGQSLAAIKFTLESALNAKGKIRSASLNRALESGVPLLCRLIESVRSIYMDLRPTLLDDFGIVAAVEWLCREFEHSHKEIEMKSQIDIEEQRVPAPLKIVLFRIVQDALSNVSRHSKATHAVLLLRTNDQGIELEVRDDGVGFDSLVPFASMDPLNREGLGISSMRERARLSGGTFLFRSERGKGTQLHFHWASPEG